MLNLGAYVDLDYSRKLGTISVLIQHRQTSTHSITWKEREIIGIFMVFNVLYINNILHLRR